MVVVEFVVDGIVELIGKWFCVIWFWISGPPRYEGGERRFGGDRDGYRAGPRGPGGDFGDKGGAPADYRPSFGVILLYRLLAYSFNICYVWKIQFLFISLFISDGNGGKVVGEQTNCYFLFNSKLFILLVSSIVPFLLKCFK